MAFTDLPIGFIVSILSLTGAAALGISLAIYNLNNEEAREYRLKLRRAQRRSRRRLKIIPKDK
jgi:mannose/fructose/N-acetylgalactosamine-specific phosphotransferase system component IIC